MGLSWRSYAEVISFEPQTVKELIEDIVSNYDTTGVYDLKIEDNSVFFNSDGYGGYGMKTGNQESLFELLTEEYEGTIACFEYAESCQAEFYCFACGTVSTPKAQSWNSYALVVDEDICLPLLGREHLREYIDRDEVWWDTIREDELCWDSQGSEWAFIWSISVDALAKKKDKMPSLYSSYQKCGDNETKITISLIGDWLADDKISEDEYGSINEEIDWDCLDSLKQHTEHLLETFPEYCEGKDKDKDEDGEGKLPENFPTFKTQPYTYIDPSGTKYSFGWGHIL